MSTDDTPPKWAVNLADEVRAVRENGESLTRDMQSLNRDMLSVRENLGEIDSRLSKLEGRGLSLEERELFRRERHERNPQDWAPALDRAKLSGAKPPSRYISPSRGALQTKTMSLRRLGPTNN